MKIGYVSDCAVEYVAELKKAGIYEELKAFMEKYKEIAYDAYLAVNDPAFDMVEFQAGEKKERRGRFAGEEWNLKYGAVLMPEIIMFVSMVANKFHAPFGTAFIRLEEEGYLSFNGKYWERTPKAKGE